MQQFLIFPCLFKIDLFKIDLLIGFKVQVPTFHGQNNSVIDSHLSISLSLARHPIIYVLPFHFCVNFQLSLVLCSPVTSTTQSYAHDCRYDNDGATMTCYDVS